MSGARTSFIEDSILRHHKMALGGNVLPWNRASIRYETFEFIWEPQSTIQLYRAERKKGAKFRDISSIRADRWIS